MDEKVQVIFRMDREERNALRRVALQEELSMAEYLRRLVRRSLAQRVGSKP